MTAPASLRVSRDSESRFQNRWFWCLFGLTLVIHGGTMIVYSEHLTEDRDAYLALATQLAEGNGFRSSADAPLTAYRPPVYPIALSFFLRVFPPAASVALLNGICSLAVVLLTWRLARDWWNDFWAALAALVVMGDPLILINATLPMTEIMFTALVLAILFLATRQEQSLRNRLGLGVCFGLAALCRPTIWPFGVLAVLVWMGRVCFREQGTPAWRQVLVRGLPVLATVGLTIAPWIIRNAMVFQAFVPMTTHGGYTLLLANNPVFYEEVVSQGWRTTWQGDSLNRWQQTVAEEMRQSLPPEAGEIADSRWMTQRAIDNIRSDWSTFGKSCQVRLLRFWNPVPMSTRDRPVPTILQWGIGLYSTILFLGAIVGLFARWRRTQADWFLGLAIILMISFSLIHAVYWSNLRMRTPLEPVLVLLAFSAILPGRNAGNEVTQRSG
ncbi:MAG: glycosyltransferase family 39 protein [Planctomycetaceae bacterium]|nr:glycosyltransferase family 39 protein [Planctomycetaceae bacterium]